MKLNELTYQELLQPAIENVQTAQIKRNSINWDSYNYIVKVLREVNTRDVWKCWFGSGTKMKEFDELRHNTRQFYNDVDASNHALKNALSCLLDILESIDNKVRDSIEGLKNDAEFEALLRQADQQTQEGEAIRNKLSKKYFQYHEEIKIPVRNGFWGLFKNEVREIVERYDDQGYNKCLSRTNAITNGRKLNYETISDKWGDYKFGRGDYKGASSRYAEGSKFGNQNLKAKSLNAEALTMQNKGPAGQRNETRNRLK
ncbi:hypothetical protein phytr_9900 [Candidatus Phycorickettsia trachydisci]|uniref:Uncharacterized protein n=1 Tax=Candidatus Phycorickettsia trachydisci TaxID=2115978 RepID=A0A2P1P9H0_9RICK|nr:hypothetical protein [Candidatus Phycorickettsia trachydisci]AVP87918.1 hypothetical protein phytr_9900 [Candidatus Phycorickettsia trachydisci]